jgi:YidC/Oxa1 family membrane protein insertase
MEKRFLLAVVLCFLILMAYQAYLEKFQKARMAPPDEKPQAEAPASVRQPEPVQAPPGPLSGETVSAAAGDWDKEPPCKEVVVDTDLYRAVFCSHTGRPLSWRLKRYENKPGSQCGLLKLFGSSPGDEAQAPLGARWVELLHGVGPQESPLALEFSTGKERIPLRERLEPDRPGLVLQRGDNPDRLTFSGRDPLGRAIRRTYTFTPDSYLVGLEIEISGIDPSLQNAGVGLALTERIGAERRDRYTFSGFMGLVDGTLKKEKELKPKETRYYPGRVEWQGFSDKYFLTCLIPMNSPISSVKVEMTESQPGGNGGLFVSSLIYNVQDHLEGTTARLSYGLYVGPKDLDVLKSAGHALEESIDLGWFGFIARPLLVVLKFFNRFTHNYGVAIILLTIGIKILFHPLTRKQYQSMREMQKLQPKLQALREKYKGDRERLNREMMDFYRTHKINPLSGCWPMLLQIPVFFALYKALLNSIELRQAPFVLWIQDLSEKDPCYVTPIIMGATMYLQQKMTPAMGDPNQQKIMAFMPLIFTVMFLQFPSGLVLYWLVNNLLSIGQQYVSQARSQ